MSLSLRTLVLGCISATVLSSIGCSPGQTMNPWTLNRENSQLKAALRQYQDQLAQAKTRADDLDADNEQLQTMLAEEKDSRRRVDEGSRVAQRPRGPTRDPGYDEEAGADIGAGGGRATGG